MSLIRSWITNAGLHAEVRQCREHLCGYVTVPASHPLHGVEYSQHADVLKSAFAAAINGPIGKRGVLSLFGYAADKATPEMCCDVHGSLTYSGARKDGGWEFGFDCAHAGDTPEVCNEDYVTAECESLAKQLAEVKP